MFGSLGDSSIQCSLEINSLLGIRPKTPELCFWLCSPGHEHPAADRVLPGGGQWEGLLQGPGQGLLPDWWVLGMQLWGREGSLSPALLPLPFPPKNLEFWVKSSGRDLGCLGFALGQGCAGDQCGAQRSFYFTSAQTLQHPQSPSAPSGISCGFPWQSWFPFLSLFPSCGSFQPDHTHS